MKYFKSILLFLGVFVVLASMVMAAPCGLTTSVCGSTPDSVTGYGAVDICNECYTCGGPSDGICPEDFYSSVQEKRPSCLLCPDPDCTATVSGRAMSTDGITPIQGAKIWAFYPPNQKVELTSTLSDGTYTATNVPSGIIQFFAEYQDFDSPLQKMKIVRGETHTGVNFELEKGTCQASCTGSFGQRCKARCDGVNGCQFSSYGSYSSSDIANLCDEKLVNERVTLSVTADKVTYVTCCDGTITEVTRPKVNVKFAEGTKIKDLVTQKIRTKYKGETVDLVITYWNEENK